MRASNASKCTPQRNLLSEADPGAIDEGNKFIKQTENIECLPRQAKTIQRESGYSGRSPTHTGLINDSECKKIDINNTFSTESLHLFQK